MTDMNLNILITAKNAADAVIGGLASSLGPVGIGLAAVAATAVGVGVASVKMASEFQTSILSLVAHAGLAQSQVNNVSNAILAMAPTVGRSPIQLAEAMYPILSAFSGITDQSAKTSLALATLKLSFETVAGTTVDGTAVANAAVGTFNALGLATNNAATNAQRMTTLMDIMDKTVQLGNMQWDAYKNVISKLAVSIQGAGVTFNEASAALATMTNEGFSAQRAQTYLANTFNTLAIKTDLLAAHAKKAGVAFNEQAYAGMDLAHKIEYLNQVTDGNKQKLLAMMGNNSTALKTFNALSVGIGAYRSNLDALGHSQGALASSFETASQGFNFAMEQLKAAGQSLLIAIGTPLLGVLRSIVTAITPIITQFTGWIAHSNALGSAMSGLGGIIAGVLKYLNSDEFAGVIADFQTVGYQIGRMAPVLQVLGPLVGAVFGVIGTVLTGVVIPAIDWFVWKLGLVLLFLNENKAAMQIVKDVLIGIGVAFAAIQIVSFLATLPALIVGFMGWAAAAGAAAIATIAATWPILLIGAIIAAVVVGILLAVQHWGQITAWLKGVWSAFASWFGGLMSALGTKVHDIVTGVGGMFSSLGTNLHNTATNIKNGVGQTFSNLGSTLHNTATNIKNGVGNAFSALGTGVVNAFKWMYDHNYYFQHMVDGLRALASALQIWLGQTWSAIQQKASAIWSAISTFVIGVWTKISGVATSVWNAISTFLTGTWNKTSSAATSIWTTITTAIVNAVTAAWNWLVSIWTTATTWLGTQWNKFTGLAQQAWNAVSGVFASIWNTYIAGPLGNLWNQFTGWFGNLANQAFQWGKNLIQGFINGIGSMFSAVGTAAHNIAQTVWSILGFHSPAKEGPGATADQWAPNLMKMYAAGIQQGLPAIRMAVSAAVQQTTPLNPAASGPLAPTGRGSSGGGTTVHHYNMGGITVNAMDRQHTPKELANMVLDELSRKLRSSGGFVTNTSGGRAF